MDFFNIFCLATFLFVCYLIIDLPKTESTQEVFNEYLPDDEFIHVIYYTEEPVIKMNNAVNKPNNSVNETNDDNNLQKHQIEEENLLLQRTKNENLLLNQKNKQIIKENLLLKQKNKRIRIENLLFKQKNKRIRKENLLLKQKNKWIRKENLLLRQENEQVIKEFLLLRQENERVKNENLLLKQEKEQTKNDNKVPETINRTNFTNSEQRFKNKTEKRRILADSEIKRLLNKLNSIDPLLANIWYQFIKNSSNIEIIESKIKYLDTFIHYQLIPEIFLNIE
ncbi:10246_t:CDS:2 [Gigaspora rosea]|nr:10246_t:CDS:2 [Gigaspora rosea]